MPHINHTNLFLKKFIFFLCIGLSFIACKQSIIKDSHPEYFNKVFEKVDTTQNDKKEEAITFLDSVFKIFPNPGVLDVYAIDSIKADIYSYNKNDYVKAIAYTDSMLLLVEKRTDEEPFAEKYARALYYKAAYMEDNQEHEQAIYYYSLAKEAELTKVKDKCSLDDCVGGLGDVLYAQGKFLDAAHSYLQDYYFQSSCWKGTYKELMNVQKSLAYSGTSYLEAGILDSASYYYQQALQFINENESKFPSNYRSTKNAKGVILAHQGNVMYRKNNLAEAEIFYKKSIDETTQSDPPFSTSTKFKLAQIYLDNNDFLQAHSMLYEIKKFIDSLPNSTALMDWDLLMATYSKKNKQEALAYEYLDRYNHLRDIKDKKDKEFSAMNLNKSLEDIEQKYVFDNLKKDDQVKTAYLIIALLASVIAVTIILFVWNNLRKTKKYVRELTKTNLKVIQSNVELQKALISLEHSHKENTRILNVVAHDLKNPISAIKNLAYSLLQKEQTETQKKVLEVIKESSDNSLSLINELLFEKKDISDIDKTSINMKKMLQYCVDMLQSKANEKNLKLDLQADEISAIVDGEKIWRVASNIINNAIKFSNPSSEIKIKLEKKGTIALLSVIDNGIGIPDAIADKIFTMSDEARRIGTEGEKSYGLGLSISKKIIEEHGGKIWFESEAGEGAAFYVELPCEN
jgi:signal transduction histidine kinase